MEIDPHFAHMIILKSVYKQFLSFLKNKAEKTQYINRCLFSTSYHHKLVSSWYLQNWESLFNKGICHALRRKSFTK